MAQCVKQKSPFISSSLGTYGLHGVTCDANCVFSLHVPLPSIGVAFRMPSDTIWSHHSFLLKVRVMFFFTINKGSSLGCTRAVFFILPIVFFNSE